MFVGWIRDDVAEDVAVAGLLQLVVDLVELINAPMDQQIKILNDR